MINPGKLVIVTMLLVALAAVGFSTWYHYQGQHRAQDFWGTTSAVLIAEGKHVRALQLSDSPLETVSDEASTTESLAAPSIEFDGFTWKVLAAMDATAARGIGNVRRALVLDTTFDWRSPPSEGEPNWQYGLEFNDGKNWATVLFDFDTRQVALTGGRKVALLDPAAADDWRVFFGEQFSDEPGQAPEEKPAGDSVEKPG